VRWRGREGDPSAGSHPAEAARSPEPRRAAAGAAGRRVPDIRGGRRWCGRGRKGTRTCRSPSRPAAHGPARRARLARITFLSFEFKCCRRGRTCAERDDPQGAVERWSGGTPVGPRARRGLGSTRRDAGRHGAECGYNDARLPSSPRPSARVRPSPSPRAAATRPRHPARPGPPFEEAELALVRSVVSLARWLSEPDEHALRYALNLARVTRVRAPDGQDLDLRSSSPRTARRCWPRRCHCSPGWAGWTARPWPAWCLSSRRGRATGGRASGPPSAAGCRSRLDREVCEKRWCWCAGGGGVGYAYLGASPSWSSST